MVARQSNSRRRIPSGFERRTRAAYRRFALSSLPIAASRKLDLFVSSCSRGMRSSSRRVTGTARPEEYDFKRIGRDGEAVEIRGGVSTPLDLFSHLSSTPFGRPAPSFVFARRSTFDLDYVSASRDTVSISSAGHELQNRPNLFRSPCFHRRARGSSPNCLRSRGLSALRREDRRIQFSLARDEEPRVVCLVPTARFARYYS